MFHFLHITSQVTPLILLLCFPQVNKIREVPQRPQLLVTHTDAPELHVWDIERQENRHSAKVCNPMLRAS